MIDTLITAFFFLEVKAQKSGQVVNLLAKKYTEIQEVSAVYAESDVIARLTAPRLRVAEILLELQQESIEFYDHQYNINDTYEMDRVHPFIVEGSILWTNDKKNGSDLKDYISAYILVDIDPKQSARIQVLKDISECNGVIYAASLATRTRIITKIRANNKKLFDSVVMDQIQKISGVLITRTLVIINEMHFVREESQEGKKQSTPDLGMQLTADWVESRNRSKS